MYALVFTEKVRCSCEERQVISRVFGTPHRLEPPSPTLWQLTVWRYTSNRIAPIFLNNQIILKNNHTDKCIIKKDIEYDIDLSG